jgi:GTP 3',8-cyclase
MLSEQTIMVANGCNLSCTYCWYEVGTADYAADTLTVEDYDRWFASCAGEEPISRVYVTGGEPLLRADIAELVGVAARHAGHVALFTNGTLLKPALAASLAASGCEVHISLDHVSGDIADRVRGGTRASLRSLEVLAEAGVSAVQVCVVLTSRNWSDLGAIAEHVERYGFGLELLPVAVPAVHPLSLTVLAPAERTALRGVLDSLADRLPRTLYYGRLKQFVGTGVLPPVWSCHAGDSGIFINSDGDVRVCAQRSGVSLGNILSSSPGQVLAAKRDEVRRRPPGPCATLDCLVLTA